VLGTDGVNKMSKSLNNHIEMAATPEETLARVMTMVTDPARVRRNDPGHPEVCNVFALHGFFSPAEVVQIEVDCRSAAIGCVDCKRLFAKISTRTWPRSGTSGRNLPRSRTWFWDVLAEGARRAHAMLARCWPRSRQLSDCRDLLSP